MADIYMDVDVALSEVPVNIFPLTDDGDFKSREVSVAYNATGMDLVWNFVTTAGAYTQTAVTPTTGGSYDWAHQGDGMYSIEIPASGGASANNDTEGSGWFTGMATGVLPWRGPVICFRSAALNNALIDGGDTLDVNVTEISGDSAAADALESYCDGTTPQPVNVTQLSGDGTAADNAEAFFDGTGYAGTNNVIPTVTTVTGLSTSTIADAVWDEESTGHTDVGKAGQLLWTAVASILVDTSMMGSYGSGLTAIPWNHDWDAEVQSECTDALNAYDPPTRAELTTDTNSIIAQVDANETKIDVIDGIVDSILADTNELQTDWHDGGRLDLILDAAGSAGDPWVTTLPGSYGAGTAGKIIGDNINATISSRSTVTTAQVNSECDTAISDAALATAADLAVVDGIVDTIVARVIGTISAGTHNPQTGDTFARVGLNGAGLTAIGDTRLSNLDTTISSRSTLTATNVWDHATRTLSSFGTLVADIATAVWGAATRTLTAFGFTVARVTLVDTCTTNTDMRGTDSAYTGTPPTAIAIRTEIDSNSTQLTAIKAKTDALPGGVAKNVALPNFYFFMVLSSDHYTGATGKTVTAEISKDGGAFAAITASPAELSGGVYTIDLAQAEMNADIITLKFTETDCDARIITIKTDA